MVQIVALESLAVSRAKRDGQFGETSITLSHDYYAPALRGAMQQKEVCIGVMNGVFTFFQYRPALNARAIKGAEAAIG
jgi:hypothetical protein